MKITGERKDERFPSHWYVTFDEGELESFRDLGTVTIAWFLAGKTRVRLAPGIGLQRADGVVFYVQDVIQIQQLGAWISLAAGRSHVSSLPALGDELKVV